MIGDVKAMNEAYVRDKILDKVFKASGKELVEMAKKDLKKIGNTCTGMKRPQRKIMGNRKKFENV